MMKSAPVYVVLPYGLPEQLGQRIYIVDRHNRTVSAHKIIFIPTERASGNDYVLFHLKAVFIARHKLSTAVQTDDIFPGDFYVADRCLMLPVGVLLRKVSVAIVFPEFEIIVLNLNFPRGDKAEGTEIIL
jgi:hypothetical protein